MKVIADAGSTKIEWCILDEQGATTTFETVGVNAVMLDREELCARFGEALRGISPTAIHYYGAGCATDDVCRKVADALPGNCPKEVASDMLGAARALLGRNTGIAAILGTGSNSALYNGHTLASNMPPLGYILGDEGSGAAIGRRLLREVYRTGLLCAELETGLNMSYGDVLQRVYRQPQANVFLASLVPFVVEHRAETANVVNAEFNELFAALSRYYSERTISFTGGVAAALQPELQAAAERAGFTIANIQSRPMQGLIEYHSHE